MGTLTTGPTYCFARVENAPRVLKLFANRTSLGFSDAGDIEPTQTIELTDDDFEPSKEIELRFVKFQRVKSVTVSVLSYVTVSPICVMLTRSLLYLP